MWGSASNVPTHPPPNMQHQHPGMYGMNPGLSAPQPPQPTHQPQQPQVKHDIFVGNLAFNTTEEQLHQAFSEIGRVINVRLVTDVESGKPKGFAFVEFQDPQAALAAIRNMSDYELNGRRLRVNFSNSSHLAVLANELGMDLSQQQLHRSGGGAAAAAAAAAASSSSSAPLSSSSSQAPPAGTGTNAVAAALKNLSKAEMYDVVAKLKEIADRDPDEARRVISGHPQLPEALLFLMSKLDMVRTPVPADMMVPSALRPAVPAAAAAAAAAPARVDPRTAMRADPRQKPPAAAAPVAPAAAAPAAAAPARVDPRQRADPRARPASAASAASGPAAAPPQPQPGMAGNMQPPPPYGAMAPPPPPPAHHHPHMPPPPPSHNVAPPPPSHPHVNIDPTLASQVMALTPQQIAMLPPDQQQSILQLRQQLSSTSGGGNM